MLSREKTEFVKRQAQLTSGYDKDQFCSDPVTKAKVEFPESLIGRAKVNFDMYSGYVPISDAPDYLFYWFFSSQDGNEDAPLVIWTNGKLRGYNCLEQCNFKKINNLDNF